MRTIIRTNCQGGHSECGVLVHVVDGKAVKIEGDLKKPMSKGYICVRGRAQHHFLWTHEWFMLRMAGGFRKDQDRSTAVLIPI